MAHLHDILETSETAAAAELPFQVKGGDFVETVQVEMSDFFSFSRCAVRPGIVAIDGGNAPIIEIPDMQVHQLHVAAVEAEQDKPFCTKKAAWIIKGLPGKWRIYRKSAGGDLQEVALDVSGCEDVEAARAQLEYAEALRVSDNLSAGSMVLLDGALSISPILSSIAERKQLAVGITKSSSILSDQGKSIYGMLPDLGGVRAAYIGKTDVAKVYMARLNEHSRYWFRIDIQDVPGVDPLRVLGQLATMSNDAAFPGYPYPLIKADMVARVTNQEAAYMREAMLLRSAALRTVYRQSHAHDVLDNMRF
ncbi:MAG: hypothetical protein ACOCWQ_05895 [Nanoarchaeota archaeon]